jgi:hypothetical protein
MAGAGVPMRLSATEIEDEADDRRNSSRQEEELNEWEQDPAWGYAGARPNQHHRRTGSGRSSLGSQRRATGSGYQPRFSTASSTPTSGHSRSPSEIHLQDLAEETPHASARPGPDYFADLGSNGETPGSGSSGNSERENSFGGPGALPERTKEKKEKKETTEDLIRRGSVDERTMTIGRGVRLFVANPDLSD